MPVATEVQTWVDGMKAVGFTDEQLKPMLDVMEQKPEAANYLKRSVMAPSEFSRQLDGLKAEKAAAEADRKKSQDLFKANTDWWEGKQAEFSKLSAAEAKISAINARLADLKEKGYLDDSLLAGIDTAAAIAVIPPKETKQYLTDEDFTKRANGYGVNLSKFGARLQKLSRQHEQVFGKKSYDAADYHVPEFDGEKLIDHIDKNGGSLESAWQAVYGVDARKSNLSQQEENIRVNQRAEELYQKRVSTDIQAGKPVPFKPTESNLRRIAGSIPKPPENPLQKKFERINRTVAALETARNV